MTYYGMDISVCPVEDSLKLINRKWVLHIIRDMFFGKSKFSEFNKERPELSNKALSRCLKYMEENNLINRIVDDETNEINYYLTKKGLTLNKVLYELVVFTFETDYENKFTESVKENTKKLFKEKLDIDD